MADETLNPKPTVVTKTKYVRSGNASNAVYGLGLIGSLIYFIQHASSFWMGIVAFFEALVWPAIVVYKILEWLKM
jgi:hypothetical protein